jgi:hypothetical protein
MARDKFVRVNRTETAALDVVLTRICAGNDHAQAAVLQGFLGRLRRVWLQPPRRQRVSQSGISSGSGSNSACASPAR